MGKFDYRYWNSLLLNRRDLIKTGMSSAGLLLFGSALPGCDDNTGGTFAPTLYGSATSVNPGDLLTLWTKGFGLSDDVPLISEGNLITSLHYLKSSGKFEVPQTASRVYTIEKQRPIIIKDPTKAAPIVVVFPYNTVAAYNYVDGNSLYNGSTPGSERARQVSFRRPTVDKDEFSQGFLDWHAALSPEKQSLFRYISDQDMDDYSEIENAKVVVIIGHSEYWTRKARMNFDKFVDGGGHAAVLSGNTMWWQVRYSNDNSALICYKSMEEDQIPDRSLVTTEWDRPELDYPLIKSIGVTWSNGGFGMKDQDGGWDGYRMVNSRSPLLEGTGLKTGQILRLPTHEYDGAPIRGNDSSGFPLLDEVALGFHRSELIGYDIAQLSGVKTVPTFIAFQKTETSGIVVNTASTNWCSAVGMGMRGPHGNRIRKITENIIFGLLKGKRIFSP